MQSIPRIEAAGCYRHPDDIDGYLALKGPVFNLLYHMAESWAKDNQWDPCRYTRLAAHKSNEQTP